MDYESKMINIKVYIFELNLKIIVQFYIFLRFMIDVGSILIGIC